MRIRMHVGELDRTNSTLQSENARLEAHITELQSVLDQAERKALLVQQQALTDKVRASVCLLWRDACVLCTVYVKS